MSGPDIAVSCEGLHDLGEGIAELNRQLSDANARIAELEGALTEIAAFSDLGAEAYLIKTGSYAAFDEPSAVQTARAILSHTPKGASHD